MNAETKIERWSIASRLSSLFLISTSLIILIATGYLYFFLQKTLDQQDILAIDEQVQMVVELANLHRSEPAEFLERFTEQSDPLILHRVQMRILDNREKVQYRSSNFKEGFVNFFEGSPAAEKITDLSDTLSSSVVPRRIRSRENGEFFFIYSTSLKFTPKNLAPQLWRLELVLDRTREETILYGYRIRVTLVLLTSLILVGFLSGFIVKKSVQPIRMITETAKSVSSANLGDRIETANLPIEVLELGQTFNQMLERLEESFARLSRFSSDIAHELRTPVNNIRGEIEVALAKQRTMDDYQKVMGSCLEECARLTQMISSLLFLAECELVDQKSVRARKLDTQALNITAEMELMKDFYEPIAFERGLDLSFEIDPGLTIFAERTLFQRALGNLIENALKYTPLGRKVLIRAQWVGEVHPGAIRFEVEDTGEGIEKMHLPHLFDRFYRVDASRSQINEGSGLGLPIVKTIAMIHGGKVSVESKVGAGSRFTIEFGPGSK